MKQASLFLVATALLGCGSSLTFSRSGPVLPPKPDSCEISMLTTAPDGAYQELGTIDIQYKSQTAWINEEPTFKKKIQPLVCHAGGDAAIAHTNDYGLYLKATVLSLQPVASAPTETPAPAERSEAGGEAAAGEKLP